MLRHTDLCSGIGGFSLGFQWAGLSEPVLFCDTDAWCRKVLAKHWPDVPIAEDVKELANDPNGLVPDCDILTAGYPCQPFSVAGKQRGEEDDRHIWPEIFAIVQAKRPTWCVFENVYGHISLGLDQVLSDLEAEGYATRTFVVPACGVDAPHRRDRLWIVGYTEHNANVGNAGCVPKGQSRGGLSKERFNSETQGQWSVERHRLADTSENVADTSREGLQGEVGQGQAGAQGTSGRHTAKRGGDVAYADSDRTERDKSENREGSGVVKNSADRGQEHGGWDFEPSVGRVAHGIPRRVDRLRGLGNAIVPQIAMRIGQTIKAVNSWNTE